MTRHALNLTLATAQAVVAAADVLDGYPSRGVDVGGGRHAPAPMSWDGTGATPIGWTKHRPRAKPGNGIYGVSLPQETQDHTADPAFRALLTAQQLALLDGLVLVDVLPPDWVG